MAAAIALPKAHFKLRVLTTGQVPGPPLSLTCSRAALPVVPSAPCTSARQPSRSPLPSPTSQAVPCLRAFEQAVPLPGLPPPCPSPPPRAALP